MSMHCAILRICRLIDERPKAAKAKRPKALAATGRAFRTIPSSVEMVEFSVPTLDRRLETLFRESHPRYSQIIPVATELLVK